MLCPCQTGKNYQDCCGRFISGHAVPGSAGQLMRSRYCAYALLKASYLRETWHPSFCPVDFKLDKSMIWLHLEVIDEIARGHKAEVEFEARFMLNGQVEGLHERSRFVFENERWLYTSGTLMPARFKPWKPGRNEACPCGSGKKFKRCCARYKP